MPLLHTRQNHRSPCYPNSSTFTANVGFRERSVCNLLGSETGQLNRVDGFFCHLPPLRESSSPTTNPYLKESQFALSHGLRMNANPTRTSSTSQKKFLIFDQSGNHTRFFCSPSFSPSGNQIITSNTAAGGHGLGGEVAFQTKQEQQFLVNPIVEEKWDENHFSGGSEMHEDTEEINALLYSNSNDEYDDGENDEVTSTGHTPVTIQEGHDKDIQFGELVEEVASSNCSNKRQKLLDGGYKKSSLVEMGGPLKMASTQNYELDVESSCAGGNNFYDDIGSIKRVKKIKIRESLKILESIIPGLKNKDPLVIIDKAIIYLKSLKLDAETLGFSYL